MLRPVLAVLVCIQLLLSVRVSAAYADEPEKVEKVVVSGVGINADKAHQNAIRNAVEQVIGSYVSSETLVKDSALIKDEILSYSGGYVKESHILSTGKDDELITVRLEALVVATKLKGRMRELNIAFKKVAGESLFGEAISKMEVQQSGADLLKGVVSKYPQSAYELQIGKAELVSSNPNSALAGIKIPIIIKLDKLFIDKLLSVFERTSEKSLFNFDVTKKYLYNGKTLVCTASQSLLRNGLADRCYILDDSMVAKVGKVKEGNGKLIVPFGPSHYSINIQLKDSAGSTIESTNYALTWENSYVKGSNYNGINDRGSYSDTVRMLILHPNANQWAPPNVVGDDDFIIFVKDGFMPLDLMITVDLQSLKKITNIQVSMNEFDPT